MIRVLICDDHDFMRGMVCELLGREPDIRVIGETSEIEQLYAELRATRPDVLLLDRSLHGHNTLDAIPEAHELSPASRILMFSADDDPAYCSRAFALGAHGYVVKESAEHLPEAIREVSAGGTYVDHRIRLKVPAHV